MSWNTTLGLWLIGGFVIYLIAQNRLGAYLAIFSGSAPTYAPASGASSPAAAAASGAGTLFGTGAEIAAKNFFGGL